MNTSAPRSLRNPARVEKMRTAMRTVQRTNTVLSRLKFWLKGNARKANTEIMRQQMEAFERYARQATEEL